MMHTSFIDLSGKWGILLQMQNYILSFMNDTCDTQKICNVKLKS